MGKLQAEKDTSSKKSNLHGELLLILAAVLWGIGFVPQRIASAHLSAAWIIALRFAIGGLVLFPFAYSQLKLLGGRFFALSTVLGLVLASAAYTQQAALSVASAGKGGFITGLYLVIVPFLNRIFLKYVSVCWFGWRFFWLQSGFIY